MNARGDAARAVGERVLPDAPASARAAIDSVGLRAGVGVASHHHGELFQGALVRGGELVRCLITMPVRGVGSTARYWVSATAQAGGGSGSLLQVVPEWKKKAEQAACLTLSFLGAPLQGRLEIESAVATGVGLGSSTCDVVATIRAICNAYGTELDDSDVARLAIEAEGAADPVMFGGDVVLFAQRQGSVLESLGSWVPEYAVLSLDTDVGHGGVDTLGLPLPSYTDTELAAFESMVSRIREAFRRRDVAAIATVATESAALNQRFLPMSKFREIRALADEVGALGVQISHSGTVAGILFDVGLVRADDDFAPRLTWRVRTLGLQSLGFFFSG